MAQWKLRSKRSGFETYLRRVVSLSKTLYSPKVLVIPRKWWLCPDMTEKLLTGMLNLNTNKTKACISLPCVQERYICIGTTHPEDGLMKLKQMESSTGIWTMRCLLMVEPRHIIVIDKGNGVGIMYLQLFPYTIQSHGHTGAASRLQTVGD